jgi:hypothetical protein
MIFYIQRRVNSHIVATVDEYRTRLEALRMLKVYQAYEPEVQFYISSRACSTWQTKF